MVTLGHQKVRLIDKVILDGVEFEALSFFFFFFLENVKRLTKMGRSFLLKRTACAKKSLTQKFKGRSRLI